LSDQPTPVPSPGTSFYADRKVRSAEHLAISAYWFATNFLWGALLVLMLPNEVKKLAPAYNANAIGLLTGLSAVVALVVPLIVGALSDRCTSRWGRRRPYIVVGVLVNLVGLAMMAGAYESATPVPSIGADPGYWAVVRLLLSHSSFLLFLLSYIVVQLGNNIASAAYSGVIPDLIAEDQRGAASGYMALMTQAGTLFGAVVIGMLLGNQSETIKYLVLGVALASIAMITVVGTREQPLQERPPAMDWLEYIKSLWIDPRKYPDFAWVWITRALVMLGFYSVVPYINYYLRDVVHIADTDKYAPILMGVILLTSSVSGIYGGILSDRIGRKKVVYIANCMIAAMALSFIFCTNFVEVMIAGCLFGLGFGAYTSVDWALGTDVLPTRTNAAKEMAVWHISMTFPQSIAGLIAAYLLSLGGKAASNVGGTEVAHYTRTGYAYVFILCAICFAAGAYLLRNVKSVR
jgi:MFS family permease